MRLKSSKSYENLKKRMRLNVQQFVFYLPESIFRRYCIQNVKDGIQIQVHNITNESLTIVASLFQ